MEEDDGGSKASLGMMGLVELWKRDFKQGGLQARATGGALRPTTQKQPGGCRGHEAGLVWWDIRSALSFVVRIRGCALGKRHTPTTLCM